MREARFGSTPRIRRSRPMLLVCSSLRLVTLLRGHGSTAGDARHLWIVHTSLLFRVCHEHTENVEEIKKCSCKRLAKARYEYFNYGKENQERINGFTNKQELIQKETKEGLRKRKKSAQEGKQARSETAKV